jgi:hypothetical protein
MKDAGSNQISVLRILPGGSLTPVPGGVVASGGVLPVSVAIHGSLVYAANSGTGGSNYTGFRLGPDGRLHPLAGSAVALPDGSQPGDVLFNSTGHNLVGARIGTCPAALPRPASWSPEPCAAVRSRGARCTAGSSAGDKTAER